jgi:hypothetical protein
MGFYCTDISTTEDHADDRLSITCVYAQKKFVNVCVSGLIYKKHTSIWELQKMIFLNFMMLRQQKTYCWMRNVAIIISGELTKYTLHVR